MPLADIVTVVIAPLRANFAIHYLDKAATVIAETGDELTLRNTGPQQFSWTVRGGTPLSTPFTTGTALEAESALRQWAAGFEMADA